MKPVILVFVRCYLPGFRSGGPIRSIANMVERLGDEFEFRIVTSDRDSGDEGPYPGIKLNAWVPQGKAFVRYVSTDDFGLRQVADIVRSTPHDVIYLNSFFSPRFTQQMLVNRLLGRLPRRPIVIAPRGEFSVGALEIKALKKDVYLGLAKWLGLYDGLVWQASSAREAEEIRHGLGCDRLPNGHMPGKGRLEVAPNLTEFVQESNTTVAAPVRQYGSPLRVCFLSRISPKKNLDFALRVLAGVAVPVRFSIYGPIEDLRYWAECQTLIADLPANIVVAYERALEPAEVVPTLAQHDLFLLPTRGENFGHVIHEALRAGLALLISDQTPWRGLVEKGVGWDLPLDEVAEYARRIEQMSGWSPAQRQQAADSARKLAGKVGSEPSTLAANRQLFLDAMTAAGLGQATGLASVVADSKAGPARPGNLVLSAGTAFHEKIAAGWSAGYGGGSFHRRLTKFRPILGRNVAAGESWLDMGCGAGVLTRELLDLGAIVVSVDESPAMIEQARAFLGSRSLEPTWIQGDAQSQPGLSGTSMDGVLCSSVIEYVDSPPTLLGEIHRLLRPGGTLILSVPPQFSAVRTMQKIVRRIAGIVGREKYPYLAVSWFEVAPSRLGQWLDDAGFDLVRVTAFDAILPKRVITALRPSLMIIEAKRK